MEKQYRYPGTRPFLEQDCNLFFGRNTDITKLSELIVLEKLVVLFSKSGYGKSSLLNAGVIPNLKTEEKYEVLGIRLNDRDLSPLQILIQRLDGFANQSTFLESKFNIANELPHDFTSILWYYAKSIQLSDPESNAICLVFDQFEELFNFSDDEVEAFSGSLATLLNLGSPKAVRRLIKQKVIADSNYFNENEIDDLLKPLNLKVVFSMRNDYLSLLDKLKSTLPEVYQYTYELKPLNESQALEALLEPAAKKGDFVSLPFAYTQEAIDLIINSLKAGRNQRIETFQLQLIGQHAEEHVIRKQQKDKDIQKFELTDKDLGKPEDILKKHYKTILASLPRKDKADTIKLVENLLIIKGNRVPLPKAVITEQHQIGVGLLNTLQDKRLLRREPNTVGGISYELSHDTLVAPIIQTAKNRQKRRMQSGWLTLFAVILFSTLGIASYRINQKNKEISIEKEKYDSLKKIADKLQTKNDSLIKENKIKDIKIEFLNLRMDSKPVVEIDTVIEYKTKTITVETPNPVTIKQEPKTINPAFEYNTWMARLDNIKSRLLKNPSPEHKKVLDNVKNGISTDTRSLRDWDFDTNEVHLIGIRRAKSILPRNFDLSREEVLFILLINKRAFKFWGSSGPFPEATNQAKNSNQLAFLAPGQHIYFFRNMGDPILTPFKDGVLTFGDQNDDNVITEYDINKGLRPRPDKTVIIEWYGKGRDNFAIGKQLIAGHSYINGEGKKVNSSQSNNKGAYEVFMNLISAHGEDKKVFYTFLNEGDLDEASKSEFINDLNRLRP